MTPSENVITEKIMEDRVAEDPEHFLGEAGLTLVSRQLVIGSYRFDLMFRDRHGGKLIVELQKGTLDRNHTYKILDYYDEYKTRNPTEFIEVMVVANTITAERKQRLRAHGIEFREIPVSEFVQASAIIPSESREVITEPEKSAATAAGRNAVIPESGKRYHFQSLSSSAAIRALREAFGRTNVIANWRLRGGDSLVAINEVVLAALRDREGSGFSPQIWMERPKNGIGVCKFEIAYHLKNVAVPESKRRREEIAQSIRAYARSRAFPDSLEWASGSTIVKCSLDVPERGERQLTPAVKFLEFLDELLLSWLKEVYER